MAPVLAAKSMMAGGGKVAGDAPLHALASARMFAQTQGHPYLRRLGANDERLIPLCSPTATRVLKLNSCGIWSCVKST